MFVPSRTVCLRLKAFPLLASFLRVSTFDTHWYNGSLAKRRQGRVSSLNGYLVEDLRTTGIEQWSLYLVPQEAQVPASSNHLPERPLTAVLAVRPWVPFFDPQSVTDRIQGVAAISWGSCEVLVSFLDGHKNELGGH